jgi:hypothetical protein
LQESERAGRQEGQYLGRRNAPEDLAGTRAEVEARFFERGVEALQLRDVTLAQRCYPEETSLF